MIHARSISLEAQRGACHTRCAVLTAPQTSPPISAEDGYDRSSNGLTVGRPARAQKTVGRAVSAGQLLMSTALILVGLIVTCTRTEPGASKPRRSASYLTPTRSAKE